MTVYFSNYLNRIKSVKKTAYEKHANFSLSFLNAIGLIYLLSWKLSFYSWVYLGNFELNPVIWEISTYLPFIFMGILTFTILDKFTLVIIHLTLIGQKIIFKFIQHLDMYYWRKTRKQGVISESIFRLQQQMISLDPLTKRRILVATIAIVAVYYCLKIEVI